MGQVVGTKQGCVESIAACRVLLVVTIAKWQAAVEHWQTTGLFWFLKSLYAGSWFIESVHT